RRVAVGGSRDAVENTFDVVETKQKGTRKRRNPGHVLKALVTATLCEARTAPHPPGARSLARLLPIWRRPAGAARRPKSRFRTRRGDPSGRFCRYFSRPRGARAPSHATSPPPLP